MNPLDPQSWLILGALGHTGPGVVLAINWADDTAKMMAGWMLLTSVTLVYAALGMDGEEQARLALEMAGPVWVWIFIGEEVLLNTILGGSLICFAVVYNALYSNID